MSALISVASLIGHQIISKYSSHDQLLFYANPQSQTSFTSFFTANFQKSSNIFNIFLCNSKYLQTKCRSLFYKSFSETCLVWSLITSRYVPLMSAIRHAFTNIFNCFLCSFDELNLEFSHALESKAKKAFIQNFHIFLFRILVEFSRNSLQLMSYPTRILNGNSSPLNFITSFSYLLFNIIFKFRTTRVDQRQISEVNKICAFTSLLLSVCRAMILLTRPLTSTKFILCYYCYVTAKKRKH